MLSVTITQGVIRQSALLSDSSKKDSSREDRSAYKLVVPGDIAYNKMRAWQGAIGVSDFRGIVSPAYVVQRLRGDDVPRYYHYLFRTPALAKEAERWSYGITSDMWSLRPEHFKLICSCHPSANEQRGIVRFLDYMDRRIRRYIRTKQKLIKLLEEQKQVIIHRAVTGQIDVRTGKPYPAYKDSGVECLGQVPEHWDVRRLRNIVNLRVSNVDKLTAEDENPIRLCNYVDVYKNERITDRLDFMRATASTEEVLRFRLERGDVLITKDSEMWTDIGVPALVEWSAPDLVCGYHLAILRPQAALVEGDFLLRAMQHSGVAHQLHVAANGVTRYGLSQGAIKSAWIPLPPIQEQVVIARRINEALSDADTSMKNAHRSIELLREYRTRLIADVVTGKLDVREAAASLPDETDEAELLEDENLIAEEDQVEEIAEEEAALEEVEV